MIDLTTSNTCQWDVKIGWLVFGWIIGIAMGQIKFRKTKGLPDHHFNEEYLNEKKLQCSENNNSQMKIDIKTSRKDAQGDLELDESFQILDGALQLFRQLWINEKSQMSLQVKRLPRKKALVDYQTPQTMLQQLFHLESFDNNRNYNNTQMDSHSKSKKRIKPSFSLHQSINPKTKNHVNANTMIELLASIQKYSVDTSHPFFFNQLFGATDPVALAAEIVALSVNTSAYTYETAPLFTLIEKEVVSKISSFVYGKDSGLTCDGIMIPGGSLSNLTAMHVARNSCLSKLTQSCSEKFIHNNDIRLSEGEEKKSSQNYSTYDEFWNENNCAPQLVAFVSDEAHYSFLKAADVIGLNKKNLISIPTLSNGIMDTMCLRLAIQTAKAQCKIPFFVGVTSGSTVRGSFDPIDEIVEVCNDNGGGIWVHVDGAWGGPAIFSERKEIKTLMRGIDKVDSFTFNPHKLLGAPQQTTVFISKHRNILKTVNSSKAKYLFDDRKNGADFDIGDALYTCGRRTDAVKFWAMLKFYGISGLGKQIDIKVDSLQYFVNRIRNHDHFMLACDPWPFNVNFFYLPERIRTKLHNLNIPTNSQNPILPDDLSLDLAKVTVKLKLLMHESGEMLIPYQPLSNQKADCFRLVIAGQKRLSKEDMDHILEIMEKYGANL